MTESRFNLEAGNLSYSALTPCCYCGDAALEWLGATSFTFTISDGNGGSDTVTVMLTK